MVSTSSSAGWPAASIACRTAAMREVAPVLVSLCTTQTALMACALSARSAASIAATSAPRRQSVSISSGCRPSLPASSCQRCANQPVSHISTRSPGDSVLASAASQAPVPEAGKMMTGWLVLKTPRSFSSSCLPNLPKSGPRWSMVG